MDGKPISEVSITHEDVNVQLMKQLSAAIFDIAALRAEVEKLKRLVLELSNKRALD